MSAGGLAVSVTLLGLTNEVAPSSMRWLYGAWAFWGASLLFLVGSIWTGQTGLRSQIAKWDDGTYYNTNQPEGRIGALTPRLNLAAIVLCGLGLVWLLVFALNNVSGVRSVTKNQDSSLRTSGQSAPQAPPAPAQAVASPVTDQRGQVAPQAPPSPSLTTTTTTTGLPGAGQAPPQAPPPTPPPPSDR